MLLVRNFMVNFPEADPRQGQVASWDSAGCTGGSEAQIADFAKPRAITEADIQIDIEVGSFEPSSVIGRHVAPRAGSKP
jgi:hypothetical protein